MGETERDRLVLLRLSLNCGERERENERERVCVCVWQSWCLHYSIWVEESETDVCLIQCTVCAANMCT